MVPSFFSMKNDMCAVTSWHPCFCFKLYTEPQTLRWNTKNAWFIDDCLSFFRGAFCQVPCLFAGVYMMYMG